MVSSYESPIATFPTSTPIQERIAIIAPVINALIQQHDDGKMADGVETFQEEMLNRIEAAGLMEKNKWLQVDVVGVHPDNREHAMLVPVDVHNLLQRMCTDGWSFKRWTALACEVPRNELGKSWCKKNVELVVGSDGLLPTINPDLIEILTGRGSHGTAAVRCMKLGCKGIHDEICLDGFVSRSKICEKQTSMSQPITKGCPYDVIKSELVEACPRLMEVLSRTGNAGNNVFRIQTALQHCNRIHNLIIAKEKDNQPMDYNFIAKQACIGMGNEFLESAKKMIDFVRVWSGGVDGHVLKNLELYERTLTVKRNVYARDLQALSKIDLSEAPRFVPAMVKSMLNAPPSYMDSAGYATLFSVSDFSSLQAGSKNRQYAIEANNMMDAASSFVAAYGRFAASFKTKLLSDFEIRCVMHVLQKKADSRMSFPSLLHIAHHMYGEAKAADDKLPQWNILVSLQNSAASAVAPGLRELREDGVVPDSVLLSKGMKIGVFMVKNGDLKKNKLTIASLDKAMKTVTLCKEASSEAASSTGSAPAATSELLTIGRVDLLAQYHVYVAVESKVYKHGSCPSPCESFELKCDIWKGHIKEKLVEMFQKSNEKDVTIAQEPKVMVSVNKDFPVNCLKLVGLTNKITFQKSHSTVATSGIVIGTCFDANASTFDAIALSHLNFPKQVQTSGFACQTVDPFLVSFWAARESNDADAVNCERQYIGHTIKVGSSSNTLQFPIITNSKGLKAGDELVVLKRKQSRSLADEPANEKPAEKAPRKDMAKGSKAKGKGKGGKASK